MFMMLLCANQTTPFIIPAVLYAETCNELAVPISASKRQGNTDTCVDVEAVANRLQRYVRFGRILGTNSRPTAYESCALTVQPSRWSKWAF